MTYFLQLLHASALMHAPSLQHTQVWGESPTRKGISSLKAKRRWIDPGLGRGDKGDVGAKHELLGSVSEVCAEKGPWGRLRLWEQHQTKANGMFGASDAIYFVWDG